ncbi:unnamed protein product, partial [Rotaria sordida]
YGVECLFRFYTYGLEKHFRQHVFEDFQQETLRDHEAGQLYGLEKFWAFLKYSRQQPKINPKLEEILKNYKNLEDFRVEGASFPQQFFPTKSGIITVPAPEAIAAVAAKNSDISNSLKPNEEFIILGRIGIGLPIAGGVINSMLYNGVKPDVIGEGTHFMILWLHRPIIFDIRTRPRSVPSITGTKGIKSRGKQSTSEDSFKICGTKSQFDAIELITQRTLISQRISELLTERAAQFGLLLDDISITHLSLRPEFTSAVELKQVARQDVEKQRFLVEKLADLIAKALDEAGDGLIKLQRIEAAKEIFIYRCEKIGVRDQCLELVPAENVQENTVEIIKQEIKGNQNYINARFRSPLANYLPHLIPPQVATAHFQLILPRDHRFGIDSIPIGIYSILLENSYYGLRKPPDQSRSSLLYVTDLYIMGKALVLETLLLLHWCQKMKLTPAILHGFSLGEHMASLAFTNWSGPLSLLSCASWSSSSTVFCDGVLSRTIPWSLLKRQFYENKAYQTFYDYLRERNRSIDSNKIVLDPIKDMMRLLMDEFTSLHNYSRPIQSNISNAMFIACTHDGYVLHDDIPHMNDVWPGVHIRYIPHGHVSAFLFNQSSFHHAIAEMLQRQEPNVKLKKNPIISPISITTPENS